MKAYVINSSYKNDVRITELELEEKPKIYKVLKKGIGFYNSIIKKEDIDTFIPEQEQIVCFDLEKGLDIYKKGIETLIEKEKERHEYTKSRFLNLSIKAEDLKLKRY